MAQLDIIRNNDMMESEKSRKIKDYWLEVAPVLSYQNLKDNPRALRTFTSLDQSEFETLLPSFEAAWRAYVYNNQIKKKTRKRR